MNIGERLKELRTKKGLSLEKLAKDAEVSASFLSQVERNIVSPSIKSLKRISHILNVPLGYFFSEKEYKGVVLIQRRKKIKVCEELTKGIWTRKIVPLIFCLLSKEDTKDKLSSHEGEEAGYIIKGKVELEVEDKIHTLKEGDSVYLSHPEPHRLKNIGRGKAIVFWVVSKPR
jgi:transcriptional regulator with XRE-family HTH domain